jgi:hypothetical protein
LCAEKISPEEVYAWIRRHVPSTRVVEPPVRRYPTPIFANERLFGVPVYIYGKGLAGNYLRHSYYDVTPTERVWQIECGYPTIYGQVDGALYPIFANGFPTIFLYTINLDRFEAFYGDNLFTVEIVEAKESQILNLDRVTQLKDSVLIIDEYDLLLQKAPRKLPSDVKALLSKLATSSFLTEEERQTVDRILALDAGALLPTDLTDQLIEKNEIIKAQNRAIWEYQRRISDYETMVNVVRAENAKYYELLSEYGHSFSRMGVELSNMQKEVIRLRDELEISMREASSLEEAKNRLVDSVSLVEGLLETLNKLMATAKSTSESITETSQRFVEVTRKAREVDLKEVLAALGEREKKVEGKKTEEATAEKK